MRIIVQGLGSWVSWVGRTVRHCSWSTGWTGALWCGPVPTGWAAHGGHSCVILCWAVIPDIYPPLGYGRWYIMSIIALQFTDLCFGQVRRKLTILWWMSPEVICVWCKLPNCPLFGFRWGTIPCQWDTESVLDIFQLCWRKKDGTTLGNITSRILTVWSPITKETPSSTMTMTKQCLLAHQLSWKPPVKSCYIRLAFVEFLGFTKWSNDNIG